eukprot:10164681-Alexandrium_andersonii.AAC.1
MQRLQGFSRANMGIKWELTSCAMTNALGPGMGPVGTNKEFNKCSIMSEHGMKQCSKYIHWGPNWNWQGTS